MEEKNNSNEKSIHDKHDRGYKFLLFNNLNPDVDVVTYEEWVSSANITDIIKDRDYDFVIDATDNFPAKFLINDNGPGLKLDEIWHGIITGVLTVTSLPFTKLNCC